MFYKYQFAASFGYLCRPITTKRHDRGYPATNTAAVGMASIKMAALEMRLHTASCTPEEF